jgi:hypothetical protein
MPTNTDLWAGHEDELRAALATTFGQEWTDLSTDDRALIVRDCNEEGGILDFGQYRHNIGAGNLAAYAAVMRARFSTRKR